MGSYDVSDESPERRFRTLFISDVHLGARGSQADLLLDFLRYHDAETIYLVGDIVDGWALKSSWHWPQSHNDLVQKLLRKARKGAKIVYIPGNHDEFLRNYYGTHFGGIDVVENAVHTGVDGKLYLNHDIAHTLWKRNIPENIKKADQNWPNLAKQPAK